jgi:hypothetical protein
VDRYVNIWQKNLLCHCLKYAVNVLYRFLAADVYLATELEIESGIQKTKNTDAHITKSILSIESFYKEKSIFEEIMEWALNIIWLYSTNRMGDAQFAKSIKANLRERWPSITVIKHTKSGGFFAKNAIPA